MKIESRSYGGTPSSPVKVIELTVSDCGMSMTADVTGLWGNVDENLIASLRQIADELEEQNNLIVNNE